MGNATATANASASSGGIGCLSLLGILFIALKLLDKITWSWWWVLAPFWAPISLLIVGLLIWAIVWAIRDIRKGKK